MSVGNRFLIFFFLYPTPRVANMGLLVCMKSCHGGLVWVGDKAGDQLLVW